MDDIAQWKAVALTLYEALPQIDEALSQANVPVSKRANEAFEIVQKSMLTVSDYKAFLVSEAHGRFLVIIQDWFKERYGTTGAESDDRKFGAMTMVHGTPFVFEVPGTFRAPGDEPGTIWIAFPATVQNEEDPLAWIQPKEVVTRLSPSEADAVRIDARETGHLARSIGFDVLSLTYEADLDIADLAESVKTDLEACARHLCARTNAGLRSAQWDASQATEKALKLYIRRQEKTPPPIHDLEELAKLAEQLGLPHVDRQKLSLVLSKGRATSIRYGGKVELSEAFAAYRNAMSIVRDIVFEARPKREYNVRELRLKMKRPPWFEFDSDGFLGELKAALTE